MVFYFKNYFIEIDITTLFTSLVFCLSSVHFFMQDEYGIIGCIRLIPNTIHNFLAKEQFVLPYEYDYELGAHTLDISRVIVAHRTRGCGLGIQILKAAASRSISQKYTN